MRVVAFCHDLIYQSYPIALFSLMAEKNFQNYGAREIPQKCSQCKQPGHNKGSSRCPVNIKNAATAALAKERQNKFSEDQIREKTTILEMSAILPISQSKNSVQTRSRFSKTTFVPTVVIAVKFPIPMQDSEQLFAPQLSVINFRWIFRR